MKFGVHLPVMEWDGAPFTMERLAAFARAAEERGLDTLSVNDHFVFRRPWLDGLTALASVVHAAPTSTLMTASPLPVIRGPVAAAKALAAIDLLSGGRLVAGLGPGSTAADYAAVNLPFDERWGRFEEAVRAIRALWASSREPFVGRYYDTTGVTLGPEPSQAGGPPIFIGSWGSSAGLRRVARLGDGWLASAYNTSPADFDAAHAQLAEFLTAEGRDAAGFPNALVTMWLLHHRRSVGAGGDRLAVWRSSSIVIPSDWPTCCRSGRRPTVRRSSTAIERWGSIASSSGRSGTSFASSIASPGTSSPTLRV